jgi:hypothetical protein
VDGRLLIRCLLDDAKKNFRSTWDINIGKLNELVISNVEVWDFNALSEVVRVNKHLQLILLVAAAHTELINQVFKLNLERGCLVILVLVVLAASKVHCARSTLRGGNPAVSEEKCVRIAQHFHFNVVKSLLFIKFVRLH